MIWTWGDYQHHYRTVLSSASWLQEVVARLEIARHGILDKGPSCGREHGVGTRPKRDERPETRAERDMSTPLHEAADQTRGSGAA